MRDISTGQFNPLKIRTVVFLFLDFTSNLCVLLLFWKCFSLKCMEISGLGGKKKQFDLLSQISGDVRFSPEIKVFSEPFISIKTRGLCHVSAGLIVAAPLAQVWLCDLSIPGLCCSWGLILGTSLAVFLGIVASTPGTAACSHGVCPAQWSLQSRFSVLMAGTSARAGLSDHRKEHCYPNKSMVLPHS